MNIRLYRLFFILCVLSFILSGIGIGITLNENNEKIIIPEDNNYYKVNYDVRKEYKKELTNIVKINEDNNEEFENIELNILDLNLVNTKDNNIIEVINVFKFKNEDKEYIQIHARNNDTKSIKVLFNLNFKDENNNRLSKLTNTLYVLPITDFVTSFEIPDIEYITYDIDYDISNVDNNIVTIDYIDRYNNFIIKNNNGDINVLFKNITLNKINVIKYTCVLYKDGHEIGVFSASNGNGINQYRGELLEFNLGDYNGLIYDDYKIYLSEAYSYNFN